MAAALVSPPEASPETPLSSSPLTVSKFDVWRHSPALTHLFTFSSNSLKADDHSPSRSAHRVRSRVQKRHSTVSVLVLFCFIFL